MRLVLEDTATKSWLSIPNAWEVIATRKEVFGRGVATAVIRSTPLARIASTLAEACTRSNAHITCLILEPMEETTALIFQERVAGATISL